MADTVERTIFKLELDGSAYVEGVDKAAGATGKLTAAQEASNKKLAELSRQQATYKKQLEEITLILQANEKETLDLTKQLNALRDAGKGTSTEAIKLKNALRDTAVNTKELKAEAGQLRANLQAAGGQFSTLSKEVKAAETANAGFTGGLSKTYGGLTRIAQLIPGMGIGGLVAIIAGPVINAFSDWFTSLTKTNNALKLQQEAIAGAGDAFVKATATVSELRLNVDLARQGFIDKDKVVEQYNTTMGKTAGTVKTLDEVEQKLVEHGDAYIQMMLLKAAANIALQGAAQKAFEAEEVRRKKETEFSKFSDDFVSASDQRFLTADDIRRRNESLEKQRKARQAQRVKEAEDEKNAQLEIAREFQEQAAAIAKGHNFNFFDDTKDPKKVKDKAAAGTKVVLNIYEQELQKLRADIAKLDEKGFTSEATITAAIEEDFKKRAQAFDKAFKNKQLTAPQVASLKGYLDSLQKLTLDQNLKSFREQKDAYLKQISTELENLQFEEATKRIATIQDRFERERQMIIAETDKTVNTIGDRRDKLIADISKNAAKNGLTVTDITPQIQSIKDVYSKLLDDLEVIKNQKLQQLSFDTFERLSEDARRLLDSNNLDISEDSLVNIRAQTELFLAGKISYEKYQKELTAIARAEADARFQVEKAFLLSEIRLRKGRLATDKTLTDDQVTKLEDQIKVLETQLANAEKGNLTQEAGAKGKDDATRKIDTLFEYATALQSVAESVIGAWQKVNEAEIKALDRSIALQERRVQAAQRIAERGNAEYLKQEEDKLNQLEIKRENAARKQMGIDAALQASQILVGITGAISHIGTGTAAQTIAEIAVIIGALATGYSLVKSLQGNQPQLAEGTTYLQRGNNPKGKDTIPAWLNEGEAVIPTDKNKAYHPTVKAVHAGSIPAEHLNNFVKNYHRVKSVQQPNYSRMKDVAELSIGQDGRLQMDIKEQNKLIQENNDLQRQTLRAMKSMAVSATIDRNGVAIAVNEYIGQMNIDKKV